MTLYFTADLHIGHRRIIEHCQRPFTSAEEMNAELVRRWCALIKPGDVIWVLGDFAWYGHEDVFHRLPGEKHLIIGNHDTKRTLKMPWASVRDYHELALKEDGKKTKLVLFHYPIRSWNGMFSNSLHLHGHCHSRLPGSRQCVDVGVDCWEFYPVTITQIKDRMATLPECSKE